VKGIAKLISGASHPSRLVLIFALTRALASPALAELVEDLPTP
jgi:hypothetical protein